MEIDTPAGRLRGRRTGTVRTFRGIRYAVAQRFRAPRTAPPWSGVREALRPGPAAPQRPSRLARAVGGAVPPWSEDCLYLDVWSPDDAVAAPVLVFLHGGGFLTGSGGLPWYDGSRLTARGGIVVVTVNYRLGAFGYAALGDGPNLGLLDQLRALDWVRDSIAAFGGDPGRVTVAGQSAGALSVVAMLGRPVGFQQAIVQSMPGIVPQTTDRARLLAAELRGCTGADPATVPVERLLDAQQQVQACHGDRRTMEPAFQLVADGSLVAADPVDAASPVPMLVGTTRDETAAMFDTDIAETTRELFERPTDRLVRRWVADRTPVQRYRFDWRPAGAPYGACHCIELPVLFGTGPAWHDAPMLAGQQPPPALVHRVQDLWSGFVRGERRPTTTPLTIRSEA
ncbi:carboxylesterase family protein [Actinocatenispora comari]|uniref:Carboxylic ester hydrolase n=1 Tax=Actinocatenispora comari TaxID=2807577 RepID=A0A8J4EIZ8_9ACTN|nr:carboxylesterase family protein [Actinocatenispora comari]GIL25403.1 carboxylic ester hydrolase [Actinocatenispora comari]